MHRRELLAAAAAMASCGLVAATPSTSAGAAGSKPSAALAQAWLTFSSRFVRGDGRVVDTGNQDITHTEGLGVAMLGAQACNDRVRFDKLWAFCQNLKRPRDGLFSWKWEQGKGVTDTNNATDGDLYIAWALHRAGLRWREAELTQASVALAQAIRQHLLIITSRGHVLLPGVHGFISRNNQGVQRAVVNPSYWVLPAFRELQVAEGSAVWTMLHKDALSLLNAVRFGGRDLPADWVLLEDPIVPWQERPARFGYEAIRIPLFLAWASKFDHPTTRAVAKFMQQPNFPAWADLDSSEQAHYAGPPGFEAVARLLRKGVYGTPFSPPTVQGDYYGSSLVLLSLLAAQDLGWV